jgi:SAM-dependent methyltransferase
MLPRRLNIPRGARVLEVGSGSRPHPRSAVLVDRYLADDEREGRKLVRDTRPLVLADGAALPFPTGAFDYCVCAHVLEHVEDPGRFLGEIQRVARAGYIETPSELHDWMFGVEPYTDIHRWFVNLEGGQLVLTRKTSGNSRHRFMHLFDHLKREDPHFERWLEKQPRLFMVQLEWQGTIRWCIREEPISAAITGDSAARAFTSARKGGRGFYWGSGAWGLKRWFYAAAVHPVWRKALLKLLGRR